MVNVITSGHLAVLYISGATTAMGATEATTPNAGKNVFTIDAPTKRVWDPTFALTPTWSAGPTGTITKNRLTGQLLSTANETTNTVTVTGKYLPMAAMLYAKDFSMSIKSKVVDTTAINCTSPAAYETKQRALSEVTGTLGTFFTPDAAATFGTAITEYFVKSLTDATVFALELYATADYNVRAWVTVDTEAIKASVNNVLEETVSFRGVVDADGRVISQL